jgi:ABC-type nitrate/sulfonate/bicarbonate transport system permease component
MSNQTIHDWNRTWFLARSLSIPIIAAVLAVVLLNTRLLPAGSFPEIIGGEHLRRGLRIIAIVFGLSCLPGGLIGVAFGSLIARNTQLSSVVIQTLRFAQWLPVLIWWVLVPLALVPADQHLGRFFFIWTVSLPAVSLGTCYHFLCTRFPPQNDWTGTIFESAKLAVLRAFYLSIVLALSVWTESWISWPLQPVVHFVVFIALILVIVAVNWVYQSVIGDTAGSRQDDLDRDLYWQNEASKVTTGLIVVLFFILWELLSALGAVQVALIQALKAGAVLIVNVDTWINIGVSLAEILSGLIVAALVTLALYVTVSSSNLVGRVLVRIASHTFAVPIVLLPLWLYSLAGSSFKFIFWTSSCVAVFSFFAFMQGFWAIPHRPLLARFLLAIELALPYAFSGMIYGEMMNAIAGLGFAMIVAGAALQTDIGLAVFLITFLLFVLLTLVTRGLLKRLYVSDRKKQDLATSD